MKQLAHKEQNLTSFAATLTSRNIPRRYRNTHVCPVTVIATLALEATRAGGLVPA